MARRKRHKSAKYVARMIKIQIREIAKKRGIKTAYQLRMALGVSPTLAARLWKEEFSQIGLNTLDRLCRVLKCQPDKIFKYEPDRTE